jgi:hypothetical protein
MTLTFRTQHFHDDDSWSYWLGSQWLCNEATKEEAEREAAFIVQAWLNGAVWALEMYPGIAAELKTEREAA